MDCERTIIRISKLFSTFYPPTFIHFSFIDTNAVFVFLHPFYFRFFFGIYFRFRTLSVCQLLRHKICFLSTFEFEHRTRFADVEHCSMFTIILRLLYAYSIGLLFCFFPILSHCLVLDCSILLTSAVHFNLPHIKITMAQW